MVWWVVVEKFLPIINSCKAPWAAQLLSLRPQQQMADWMEIYIRSVIGIATIGQKGLAKHDS